MGFSRKIPNIEGTNEKHSLEFSEGSMQYKISRKFQVKSAGNPGKNRYSQHWGYNFLMEKILSSDHKP